MSNSTQPPKDRAAINRENASHSTGPRTPEGKERSKQNVLKHGIFSKVVVLKGESRAQYESLLKGLWETLQPEGKLEETVVEKLATILWRHRRLLVAEGAEIRKNVDFLEWDQQNQQREKAEEIGSTDLFGSKPPLIRNIENPDVLDRCLELLTKLREEIEADGLDEDCNTPILEMIYGRHDDRHLRETLYDAYYISLDTAEASEEERQREELATPEQCKETVLQEINSEIDCLKCYQKTRKSIESDRTKLETLCRSVLDSPGLDRLLPYEASLERAFDRTLNQLDRLQRMRRGQPVPPRIDVTLSS